MKNIQIGGHEKMSRVRQDDVREPRQKRSRQRVEQILDAAKKIILSKGCAGLSMSGVAQQAGITAASIYQYFPSKKAIIHALGEQYLDLFNARLIEQLANAPENRAALTEQFLSIVDSFYALYRDDPVVRDVWMGAAADKEMQNLDARDTERNLALFFAVVAPFFSADAHKELRQVLRLLMHFGVSATRVAVDEGEAEGSATIQTAKRMMLVAWRDFCQRHPEVNLIDRTNQRDR